MKLIPIAPNDRKQYMSYLLLADESESIIHTYMEKGDMFAISFQEEVVGVVLFVFHSHNTVELKNIAILPSHRGKKIGQMVIEKCLATYKQAGWKKMIVGTANSSISNLAFYQKVGFRIYGIKEDFFLTYPEPIYENGIQAIDMIMLKQLLNH